MEPEATWVSMSIDACKASRKLREKHPRSAISRAYYAAYAAVTSELKKDPGVTFSADRGNPAHGSLLDYIQQSLPLQGHSAESVDDLRRCLRELRRDRERADYLPHASLDMDDAKEALRRAESVIYTLRLPL